MSAEQVKTHSGTLEMWRNRFPHHEPPVPLCRDAKVALYRAEMPSFITVSVCVYGYGARLL